LSLPIILILKSSFMHFSNFLHKNVFHQNWSGKLTKENWGEKLQVIPLRKNKTITSRSPLRFWESMPVGIWSRRDHFIPLTMQSVRWSSLLERIFFLLGSGNLLKIEGVLRPWMQESWFSEAFGSFESTRTHSLRFLYTFSSPSSLLQGAIYSENKGVIALLNSTRLNQSISFM